MLSMAQDAGGVFRGEPRGPCPPNRRMSGFFTKKAGFVGTILSTKSVLWTSNMPKCVGGRGSAPDPTGGAHDTPPDPLVG